MTHRLEFRPEASADVAEAFSWYEAQRPALGTDFEAELDRTLYLIQTIPAAGPVVYRALRRALLHRFPFAIYYTLSRISSRFAPSCTSVEVPRRGGGAREA